ncbi:MAG: xanthine dehydrogenase [Bacteroidetes bacterium HGW-Bacteroidetes-16]|jgi:xanthine dehydrogenase large subunit|nr:MAG: xanthine dehydrogenase [Bacteroidetes bacterium HGW-Bacteroidetes-16]
MKNIDSTSHLSGKSIFIDDMPEIQGTLFASVVTSPIAHGSLLSIDFSEAETLPGILRIFTYRDITGENQIGGIVPDEPLFAEKELHFVGQPVALIVGKSDFICQQAKQLVTFDMDIHHPVTTATEAFERNQFISPSRTFKMGDPENAWKECAHVFEGTAESGGQEHLYLETQGAYAIPMEKGKLKIYASTQGPTAIQKQTARVLGIPMHQIEVDVNRLGGGFGGKEDQATPWAVMVALAAHHLKKPVKMILSRHDDMYMTGKRHPYTTHFKIGLSKEKKILAYEANYLQNAGAAADLSPAITERTLFHCTNSYFIPNVKATVHSCKTNLPPNTAFRGFGAPQGMFAIECAIHLASKELNIPVEEIQKINLLKEGDEFPYGQKAQNVMLDNSWYLADKQWNIANLQEDINQYNAQHSLKKKGFSIFPITFGVSFTNTVMNHARALVHIYQDGSVGISTGAVEMGQSINTKMMQVAAGVFSIDIHKINIESTNTTRVANTSPSAASSTADLNGKAVQMACNALLHRLKKVAATMVSGNEDDIRIKDEMVFLRENTTGVGWEKLVKTAFLQRVSLSESSHYATPEIHFDKSAEKGHPFAYHVFGLALTTVLTDCLRGTYEIEDVKIVHDFGKSMNQEIDLGQVEGALMQGIGWMTMEEIAYDKNGILLSNALSTYKVPDLYSAPKSVEIIPLENESDNLAILKSKAVGEPPFNYGIGAYFAIQQAIKAFNPDYSMAFNAPMTPEKVLMGLYEQT